MRLDSKLSPRSGFVQQLNSDAALLGRISKTLLIRLTRPVYDAMGSICIGVVLLIISAFVAWRVRSLLVGRWADPEVQAAIEEIIEADPDIIMVFNTITIQFGPDTMLAVKVKMDPDLTINEAIEYTNDLERNLKERIPKLKWCFVEPDVTD